MQKRGEGGKRGECGRQSRSDLLTIRETRDGKKERGKRGRFGYKAGPKKTVKMARAGVRSRSGMREKAEPPRDD